MKNTNKNQLNKIETLHGLTFNKQILTTQHWVKRCITQINSSVESNETFSFLNQIDIIPNSLKTEAEVTDRSISKPIRTEIESDPLIEHSYHFKLHKLGTQRAQRIQQSLPDLPLMNKDLSDASPIDYQRPLKRTRLFLRRQESKLDAPVLKFQRRRVEFKKSLVVIDIETGTQDRQELNEVKKPLRRIAHQKTRSYQKKLE